MIKKQTLEAFWTILMSVAGKHFRNFHVKHLQNKEKGGLGVLREHVGHNEDEGAANEDPGVNSDNEEEDEFKVEKLHLMQFFFPLQDQRLNPNSLRHCSSNLFSPVWDNQPAKSSGFNQSKRTRGAFAVWENSTRSALGLLLEVEHPLPSKSPRDVECLADVFRKVEKRGKPRMGRKASGKARYIWKNWMSNMLGELCWIVGVSINLAR